MDNYIAGIQFGLRQPCAPLDQIVVDGHEGKVRSEVIRRVKLAQDQAGIDMPKPTYNLEMTDSHSIGGDMARSTAPRRLRRHAPPQSPLPASTSCARTRKSTVTSRLKASFQARMTC